MRLTRKNRIDYRQRWPTVQTLVESRDDHGNPISSQEKKSRRIRALQAVSTPLLWINMRLEDWQVSIDHRVALVETRQQSQLQSSTSSKSKEPQQRDFKLLGHRKPGKSTHPYDTAVGRPASTEEEQEHRHSTAESSCPRMRPPAKGSTNESLRVSTRPSSTRDDQSNPDSESRAKRIRFKPKIKLHQAALSSASQEIPKDTKQRQKSATIPVGSLSESKTGKSTRKKWWWPFAGRRAPEADEVDVKDTVEQASSTARGESIPGSPLRFDVTRKNSKGRHASRSSPATPIHARARKSSVASTRRLAQKNAAQNRLKEQMPGTVSKDKTNVSASNSTKPIRAAHTRIPITPATSGKASERSTPLSHKEGHKTSISSAQTRPSTAGSAVGSSAGQNDEHGSSNESLWTSNHILRLLSLPKRTPPSSTISPLDTGMCEITSPLPLPGRASFESRISRHQSLEGMARVWASFWGSPKALPEDTGKEPRKSSGEGNNATQARGTEAGRNAGGHRNRSGGTSRAASKTR
ncbi:hypothetical protein F5Y15DRAFT_339122 [Xylariaceae sp. FL0016]|nr:hypothetical protein F5Y15DRAFT_339122 [Xylariaceae sp. FL0016]